MSTIQRFRPPHKLRFALLLFLGANVLTDGFYAAMCALIGVAYPDFFDPSSTAPYKPGEEAVGLALVGIGLVGVPIYLTTVVLFCCWMFRANTNARALGARGMTITPGWSVGWWFIPVACLWKPFQAMREIHQASDPDHGPSDWSSARVPATLGLWWAAWICMNMVSQVDIRLGSSTDPALVAMSVWTGVISGVFSVAAAILVMSIIRQIDQRQMVKAAEGSDVLDPTCLTCGYDLRGSRGSATCPECGAATPLAVSEGVA